MQVVNHHCAVADQKQKELEASKDKEHQLQTELDKTECASRAKDQQILSLREDLQELQEKLTAPGEASKESSDQMEPNLLQGKGEHSDSSEKCVEIKNIKNPSIYCNTNCNELTHFLHYDSTCSSNKKLSLIQGSLKVANFLTPCYFS